MEYHTCECFHCVQSCDSSRQLRGRVNCIFLASSLLRWNSVLRSNNITQIFFATPCPNSKHRYTRNRLYCTYVMEHSSAQQYDFFFLLKLLNTQNMQDTFSCYSKYIFILNRLYCTVYTRLRGAQFYAVIILLCYTETF